MSILANLIKWIANYANAQDENGRRYVRNVPALIIDDEADIASVDTKQQVFGEDGKPDEDHDPVKTNRNIRLLLRSFEKVAYVAYTATPFANIYIHDKGATKELGPDLFPKNYIVNIPAPSNYMGPARIFGIGSDPDAGIEGMRSLPIARAVSDHADTDAVDETAGWMPPKLEMRTEHIPRYKGEDTVPPSMKEAIMAYLLAVAVRRLREQGPTLNTMLIHVVRYKQVQKKVADQVQAALKEILQRLRNGDGSRRPTIMEEFGRLWRDDFVPTTRACREILVDCPLPDVAWDDVHPLLEGIAAGIKIKVINGSAGDVLDYEKHRNTGLDIIAIGGDKLSRGLTLDGLSVSYFLRASRMYDTLMQMGRWFGYREKYIDVCRLYTTPELDEWFAHIAAASEELQREFEYMASVGGTPKDYGLKVRSHPVMLVTSAVKMRNGTEMDLSFRRSISETTKFLRDRQWIEANLEATRSWLGSLGAVPNTVQGGHHQWTASAKQVLDFLPAYKTHDDATLARTGLLSRYIKARVQGGELLDWTVCLLSSGLRDAVPATMAGKSISLIKRAPFPNPQQTGVYSFRRLVSPNDESLDLSPEQRKEALAMTIRKWETDPRKSDKRPTRPNGLESRLQRSRLNGLLLLYPLDPVIAGLPSGDPIIGLAISFPDSGQIDDITYTVNNVFTSRGGDDEGI